MMKLLLMFILFVAGFSYSQTFRPIGSRVQSEISVCTQWETPAAARSGFIEPSRCLNFQTCTIQLYTTDEPIIAVCSCHIRRSSLHPAYDKNANFPSRNFNGVHLDANVAEEEARAGCLDESNRIIGNQNPGHWVTSIRCGVRYRYNCADGSTEMRDYY